MLDTYALLDAKGAIVNVIVWDGVAPLQLPAGWATRRFTAADVPAWDAQAAQSDKG